MELVARLRGNWAQLVESERLVAELGRKAEEAQRHFEGGRRKHTIEAILCAYEMEHAYQGDDSSTMRGPWLKSMLEEKDGWTTNMGTTLAQRMRLATVFLRRIRDKDLLRTLDDVSGGWSPFDADLVRRVGEEFPRLNTLSKYVKKKTRQGEDVDVASNFHAQASAWEQDDLRACSGSTERAPCSFQHSTKNGRRGGRQRRQPIVDIVAGIAQTIAM